jgi:hypothetical protein
MNDNARLLLVIFVLMFFFGCADNLTLLQAIEAEKVGFLYGLWHGIILLFSFVGSLLLDDVAIYAIYNNGGWYDFGYFLGIAILGGSLAKI